MNRLAPLDRASDTRSPCNSGRQRERHAPPAMARHRRPRPVARQLDLLGQVLERLASRTPAGARSGSLYLPPIPAPHAATACNRHIAPAEAPRSGIVAVAARRIGAAQDRAPAAPATSRRRRCDAAAAAARARFRPAQTDGHAAAARARDRSPRCAASARACGSAAALTSSARKPGPCGGCFQDQLAGNPERVGEDRAQALVPLHQVPERRLQRITVERAGEPHRQRDGVGRARTFQLVQEPQPALRKRQRDLDGTHRRPQRRPRGLRMVDTPDQRLHGRRLEQAADRKLDIERGTDAADQPRRQQRMAAQLEEVVVDADCRTPSTSANSAHSSSSRGVRGARCTFGRREIGRRQRLAVELAVGRERQAVQCHERRRHHVVRQARCEMRTQRRGIGASPPHKPPAACRPAHPRAR